ncbi:MAG: RNB domain-containing ribonuclease [Gemmatimonadaceae bacterium]|nr:RNB domain-containing ribonuclease [Gemmatimonadaceae bacterium]
MMTTLSGADLHAVAAAAMRANGFAPDFSAEVLREVEAFDDPGNATLPVGARDLRALPWSSIDNRESRDLDQIEAAERCDDGRIRLLVAIADVASFVPPGSASDDHSAINTTSVYTGVAVFPMLPERLSTDLTSLNEGEDRLAVVIQFDVAADGALSGATVYRALVHNYAKLTYNEIGAWLEGRGPEPRAIAASQALRHQLQLQEEAAGRLRIARKRAGALDFESVEASPVVANGKVIDLRVTQRNRARDIIEDFMVAANRSVAAYLIANGSASLRRVVREPKRWDRIVAIAAEHGVMLPEKPDSVALSEFLSARRVADPEHFADLSLAVVKLLGPGVYVLERRLGNRREAGHFGLAVADYVHSTAPNRRFADLVTQRMLRAVELQSGAPYTDEQLIAIANRCTERGDAARKVERTMRKVAGASMLADRVGESFAAVVTAASPKGTYVRLLSPPVEGRVVRGGPGLDVGDTVRVTLVVTDAVKGFIDFAHDATDASRKLERSRRKKVMADALRPHIGEQFQAIVTGVSDSGTWVRLVDRPGEGRVVRGFKSLAVGMTVPVTLVRTDSVHGFIDFEHTAEADRPKAERLARKRVVAERLQDRIGETFDAVVSGVSPRATWIHIAAEGIEGRLVRGQRGRQTGDAVRAVLLTADPVRGFIDFATES